MSRSLRNAFRTVSAIVLTLATLTAYLSSDFRDFIKGLAQFLYTDHPQMTLLAVIPS